MKNLNISPDSLVLAIDTATPVQSLAILRGRNILFEASAGTVTKDGPGLLSLVDAALRHCELALDSLDRLVVSRGPGAFTGLRVSMAMLKSFAITLDRPLYAASSLEALARDAMPSGHVTAACIDARRGEIYAAFYGWENGAVRALSDVLLLKPEDFAAYVSRVYPDDTVVCVGTAFPHYTERLTALCPKLCCRPAFPRAACLGRIVLERFPDAMPDVALEALEPRYIRIEDFALPKPFDFSTPGQFRHDTSRQ